MVKNTMQEMRISWKVCQCARVACGVYHDTFFWILSSLCVRPDVSSNQNYPLPEQKPDHETLNMKFALHLVQVVLKSSS